MKPMQPKSTPQYPGRRLRLPAVTLACAGLAALLAAGPAAAQSPQSRFPVTPGQRSTADAVAQTGVPLAELAPNAPDQYTVKRGDTLWGISGVFLKSPWRWPELWGMNMEEVRNPHLIYPGQLLVLEKMDGRARLRFGQAGGGDPSVETVKVSPRVRINPLGDGGPLPTLQPNLIEPFLAEPLIVDDAALKAAPRIVAVPENRVLITRGDRAYARGLAETPLMMKVAGRSEDWRVFRDAKAIRHPDTRQVLGYEAQYVGKAQLVRSEATEPDAGSPWWSQWTSGNKVVIPATIDIVSAKEEMRVGDRLLPEPPRQFVSYVPHAPAGQLGGTIVSVYGDAVSLAGQNQVVVIDKGTADGVDTGTVLAIMKTGDRAVDRTQAGQVTRMRLPDERNGILMVFRPFEKLSYALILEINDSVQIGDRVASPR
jgi:nucleoid-associated protein YgaU